MSPHRHHSMKSGAVVLILALVMGSESSRTTHDQLHLDADQKALEKESHYDADDRQAEYGESDESKDYRMNTFKMALNKSTPISESVRQIRLRDDFRDLATQSM
eukprot:gnl/TRDRNA2_/TRDRNA2_150523_c0_seq2.p1 gnl/TRDRNA2_/TRDRNA2_150523_c0~~gnl/TRDRNA2_/TRDRNA2_150523_c0_seq2.p1  ORF type:complete len:104 (+),score=18.63 gnl/TRDRNA2_/TRDRNA2_150523_c0_seq2:264-575(+)